MDLENDGMFLPAFFSHCYLFLVNSSLSVNEFPGKGHKLGCRLGQNSYFGSHIIDEPTLLKWSMWSKIMDVFHKIVMLHDMKKLLKGNWLTGGIAFAYYRL